MKIALIADIHGNLPAIKTVLKHARSQGAREIWNAGDTIGFGPFPDEVIRLLDKNNAISIIGNADRKALRVKSFSTEKRGGLDPEKWSSAQWAFDHLSKSSQKLLSNLPRERRFLTKDWKVLITHGSPASEKEHLGPETPEERLRELAGMNQAQIIICGHSHRPFARLVDETWFINPGSVGRPDDGDPRASYSLLRLKKNSLDVAFFRLEYDFEKFVRRIRKFNLPDDFAFMFAQGNNMQELAESEISGPDS
ncbi:MAG: metallophosphoesterase [Anaerolineaceae bacterium]